MTVISLNSFRAEARRRSRIARLKGIGFATATLVASIAILTPGLLVTGLFIALRAIGVVDWSVIWLLLPMLIDVGLWLSAIRSEATFRAIAEHDGQDEGA